VRQLPYRTRQKSGKAKTTTEDGLLDMALFLNGIPLFTVELKISPATYKNAVVQYQTDRDPKEPLFAFKRCLAHFAMDTDLVYMTTRLSGKKTFFLPLNKGYREGARNPPSKTGYAVRYMWEDVWTQDSVLELIQQFVHVVKEPKVDAKGRRSKSEKMIFPRYHQRDSVRRLVADAREKGAGQRYLVQHSAGSGKSYTIAWLAHRLASLHDRNDQPVFNTVIIITDRRILDRQLQATVKSFQQRSGVVENIDKRSRQLGEAIEDGKKIIVTTLQKFPVIDRDVRAMADRRFAVIIDEAHSSQSGESSASVKKVLSWATLEEAAKAEGNEPKTMEDRIEAEMRARGPVPNVSMFAFTATPKPKTLQTFGVPRQDGTYEPFSLYSMRQAIEERFIVDVLENYTTYRSYWRLLKKIEDDPHYETSKAKGLLKRMVELDAHAITTKVAVIVDDFENATRHCIKGEAKAMVVTRSRKHAVRYCLALRAELKQRKLPGPRLRQRHRRHPRRFQRLLRKDHPLRRHGSQRALRSPRRAGEIRRLR
jgi:type I restriction enzyme R subunit